MREGHLYIVIGNLGNGVRHFCHDDEIVIGTGIDFGTDPTDKRPYFRYERGLLHPNGKPSVQWISNKDVFEIGRL